MTSKMDFWFVIACFGFLIGVSSQRKSYEGYKLIDIEAKDKNEVEALYQLKEDFDFWTEPQIESPARVLVSPEEFNRLQNLLKSQDISYEIFVNDLQKSLEEGEESYSTYEENVHSISFTKFPLLQEVFNYLDHLADNYPNLVTVTSIGKSLEGRDLKLIRISTGGHHKKPAIFIDATIHAREWISTPVALYTIHQLVENHSNHSHLLDNVDWYILPVINPDGFEYTHTTERFWRKTRSYNGDRNCLGVDANRNFDFQWAGTGSSASYCSETYSGPSPLSEPEIEALTTYLLNTDANIQLYLTLHSYGQLMLHPWGYTIDPPEDVAELESLAREAVHALEKVRGTKYTVGSSAAVLYYSSGTSRDWAKGKAGIKYSYTMELPPGGTGFNPPASDIIPVVVETFEAIKVFARAVGET